jgi:hypothetical protein
MRTRALVGSLLTILSLALAQSAYSTFSVGMIDVDFTGGMTSTANPLGPAVIGSTGDFWNVFTASGSNPATALKLTTGVASAGVTLQISGSQYITGTSGGANGPNAAMTEDFLAVGGAMQVRTGTITLAGLTANQNYDLYLYNGSTSVGRITDFNVTNGSTTVNGSITNVGTPGAVTWTPSTAIIPANYLQLNVAANSTGQLVIKFMNKAAFEGDFAGFQIRAIPEPSTYALFATGAAALLIVAYRARRRASGK